MLNRSQDAALLIGRLFVSALFLPSGFHKLVTFPAFAASLGSKGLPAPTALAAVMVAAEVLGALALILGAWPRWTALALIAFTAAALWIGHRSAGLGPLMRPRQNVEFYRTLAIIGGLLFYFASGSGAWSWRGGGRGS